jgi:hypothetical protein
MAMDGGALFGWPQSFDFLIVLRRSLLKRSNKFEIELPLLASVDVLVRLHRPFRMAPVPHG